MKRLVRLALVLSVLYGTGAHWAALQMYAWGAMRMAGKTDPCSVCKIVEKGQVQQGPKVLNVAPSLDFAVPVAQNAVFSSAVLRLDVAPPSFGSAPPSSPLTPPPDASLA